MKTKTEPAKKTAAKTSQPEMFRLANDVPADPADPARHLARDYHAEFPLSLLAPSPKNARTTFEVGAMAELSASVRAKGVQTPLWARKLREADANGCTHEVFGGERRRRAALAAGLLTVPVFDYGPILAEQADEMADLENCQRENLNDAERALAYARMVKDHGWQYWDENNPGKSLAHRLNLGSKTKAYEWARIARLPRLLLDALAGGELNLSVVVQLSRIGDPKRQSEAAQEAIRHRWTDKEAGRTIEEKFLTELKGAPFDRADEKLIAAVGSCARCPWRTGNQMELPEEFRRRGDVCTKPECYRNKVVAAFEQKGAAHKAAGGEVWTDKQAASHGLHVNWSSLSGEFVELDAPDVLWRFRGNTRASKQSLRELLKKELAAGEVKTILALERSGGMRILEIVRRNDAEKLLRKNGTVKKDGGGGTENDAEKKRQAKRKKAFKILDAAMATIVEKARTTLHLRASIETQMLSAVVLALAEQAPDDLSRSVAKRLNLTAVDFSLKDEVGWWRPGLRKYAASVDGPELAGLLAELVCHESCGWHGELQDCYTQPSAAAVLDLLKLHPKKLIEQARETVEAAEKVKLRTVASTRAGAGRKGAKK
jgi:ParB/RepB/Spo0J family partition protein